MNRIKCAVKNCEKDALVAYGNNWICGNCMMKIIERQNEKQNKEIEELGEKLGEELKENLGEKYEC
jgi:hypothetical protein